MEQESDKKREAEESSCRSPNAPILCANNCGFFGSAATNNLCSKCYRDFFLKKSQSSTAPAAENKQKKVEEPSVKLPVQVDGNQETTSASDDPVKQPSNRCNFCRKRVGLIGFNCRCGQTFCSLHRYSDKHSCPFDYRKVGQDEIARENPVVKADKIEKI